MYLSRLMIPLLAAGLACGGSDSAAPDGGGASNPPPPGTAAVTINDFAFSPATITIKAGGSVKWTNAGPSAHTTTSDANVWASPTLGAPRDPGGGYGDTGSPGGTFQFTFTEPGTYPYHCSLHPPTIYPNFVGTITVTP
jgi:plastocyanin